MLLIELLIMQDYKVQQSLKQIQIIFRLWQRITTTLIIMKTLKKPVTRLVVYSQITKECI